MLTATVSLINKHQTRICDSCREPISTYEPEIHIVFLEVLGSYVHLHKPCARALSQAIGRLNE